MSNDPRIAPSDRLTLTVTITLKQPQRFDNNDLTEFLVEVVEKVAGMDGFDEVHAFMGYQANATLRDGEIKTQTRTDDGQTQTQTRAVSRTTTQQSDPTTEQNPQGGTHNASS